MKPSNSPDLITIGTRGSALALWQANWAADTLRSLHPGLAVELRIIKTQGDKITDVALAAIGGKGLFTKEIETALLSGDVDLAVHSLKDLPTDIPDGLCLGAHTAREDPRDALVTVEGLTLDEIPEGAVIGTSSLRRQAQLSAYRPDLRFVDLRGNVDTRVRKLREQNLDGIVLASAGINRLGVQGVGVQPLDPAICLPAPGQGILGLEVRADDDRTAALIAPLNDPAALACAVAERTVLASLGGGCQVPLGALAEAVGRVATGVSPVEVPSLRLRALVASLDGSRVIRTEVTGSAADAADLGLQASRKLREAGADAILASCNVTPPAPS